METNTKYCYCKGCGSIERTKDGIVRGKQRYKCKDCGCHYTETAPQGKPEAMKSLAVLMYSLGKSSYGWIGRLLGVSNVAVFKWIKKAAQSIPEPEVREDVKEMELDEMWHFIESKKRKFGSGRPMTVISGDVSPGVSAIVILLHSNDCGAK